MDNQSIAKMAEYLVIAAIVVFVVVRLVRRKR